VQFTWLTVVPIHPCSTICSILGCGGSWLNASASSFVFFCMSSIATSIGVSSTCGTIPSVAVSTDSILSTGAKFLLEFCLLERHESQSQSRLCSLLHCMGCQTQDTWNDYLKIKKQKDCANTMWFTLKSAHLRTLKKHSDLSVYNFSHILCTGNFSLKCAQKIGTVREDNYQKRHRTNKIKS